MEYPWGENAVQVLFIYDEESKKMDAFQPSDLEKELNNVAFKSQLGEFALYSFDRRIWLVAKSCF